MEIKEILKKYWHYNDFRGIQREIIEDVMAGRDVLGLMPTGGGKSITFQVPALALEGVCIVITPLIALMKDQVQNLRKRHIRAAALFSGQGHNKALEVMDNAVNGGLDILYVSPERLDNDLFQAKLRHMRVSFFTIDEAHCICQWGYDFRPAYLNIAKVRKIHPDAPVLALTATATPQVVEDIQQQLAFHKPNCRKMSFRRDNLAYIVEKTDDKIQSIVRLLNENPGSAIIYVSSREKTHDIAETLRKLGIPAESYNAGMSDLLRDVRQKQWTEDRTRVIVATNAFGMGIDKPDVRIVINHDCPTSLEAYFQEAGRAGRDGKPAKAVLLHTNTDNLVLSSSINRNFPEQSYIQQVYEQLCYYYEIGVGYGEGFSKAFILEDFCRTYKLMSFSVVSALHILTNAGYIKYEDMRESLGAVRFITDRDRLYLLKNLSERENEIIAHLLRTYTGLFTRYASIDENQIAKQLNLSYNDVYQTLRALSSKSIIRYIPRSAQPYVSFTINRVAPEHFFLPHRCYALLKEKMQQRVECVRRYLQSTDTCRLNILLEYFGEQSTRDCNLCDICLSRSNNQSADGIQSRILQKLSDNGLHHISELTLPEIPSDEVMRQLRILIRDGKIRLSGTMLKLAK